MVKSVHGPSVVLSELINNLELAAHSTTILRQRSFHPTISLLIQQFLASKKYAVPTLENKNDKCRLGNATSALFPHALSYLKATYGEGEYVHHSLYFHHGIPFTVHRSCASQIDDSAVMYTDDSNTLYIGIIVGIIRLKRNSQVLFLVEKSKIHGYDAFSLDNIQYINDFSIDTTTIMPPEIISLKFESIKQKVAYRVNENTTTICGFHIFPNLLEST